jgi:molybdopterin-binding protein
MFRFVSTSHEKIPNLRMMKLCLQVRARFDGEKNNEPQCANQVKGKVVEVHKGATTAHVLIEPSDRTVVTSSITNEAVDELDLKIVDTVSAINQGVRRYDRQVSSNFAATGTLKKTRERRTWNPPA